MLSSTSSTFRHYLKYFFKLTQTRKYPRNRRNRLHNITCENISNENNLSKSYEPDKNHTNIILDDIKQVNKNARDQSSHSFRPKIDPELTTILLFPGQGSQFVGMGKKLLEYPNVKELYNMASQILGYDLLQLCMTGPKDKLDRTVYCQPAIFVTSIASIEKLKHTTPDAIENCVSVAGYSIGELTALTFAGSIAFEEAIHLVKIRAEAMQEASTKVSGQMMTVFIDPTTKLKYACHVAKLYLQRELGFENPVCDVSNYLHPDCKVLSGHSEALDFISKNASEFGIRKCEFLPVSGAFHSHLMYPSKLKFSNALKEVTIETPIVPVHSNVNAHKHTNPQNIKKLLVEQIFKPVMWEQTMHVLYSRSQGSNFPRTYEVGPGRQLGSILRKINAKAFQSYHNIDC